MKKLSFLLLILMLLMTGCRDKNLFTLKGNIGGLSSDTLLVVFQEPVHKLDTIIAQKGKFSYEFTPDTFTIFSLLLDKAQVLPIYADKGQNVTLEGTKGNTLIKGKGENEQMARILRTIKEAETKPRKLQTTIDSLITNNPTSYTNIYLIDKYYVHDSLPNYHRIKELIDGLSGTIKDTQYMMELQGKLEEKTKINHHQTITSISYPDKNGKKIDRNDLKDKYVLVDFWASWDSESVIAQDSLVSVQKALKKEKFLIISLSLDIDKEAWLNACNKDTTQWKQVCDFTGWGNSLVRQQGIIHLPANMLLDPNRRVIARDIRGKELINKVKHLIKQDKEREKAAKAAERSRKKKKTK